MISSLLKYFKLSRFPVAGCCIALAVCAPVGYSETIPLESLLNEIENSPEVAIARLNRTISTADAKRHKVEQNWELFGGAGVGNIEEAVTENRTRNHTDVIARVGLRYPFLAGNNNNERALQIAEGNAQISEIRLKQSTGIIQYQIEEAYGQYWGAQNKVTLSNAYTQLADQIKNILKLRRNAGLLLESDRQEFLAGFEQVNYIHLQQSSRQTQALNKLRRLTGRKLPPFDAVKPAFYQSPVDTQDSDFLNQNHPELQVLNIELETQRKQLQASKSDRVYAHFVVRTDLIQEISGPTGYGVYAGVNFRMPLFYNRYKSADDKYVEASIHKSEFEHQQRNGLLIEQARLTESLYRDYATRIELNKTQLNALGKVVEERSRRVTSLDGDVLSALVAGIYRYYIQSIELIDVQMKLWNTQAKLRQFPLWYFRLEQQQQIDIPNFSALSEVIFDAQYRLQKATNSSPTLTSPKKQSAPYAVYLWRSHDIVNQSDPHFWQQLQDKKVGKILLSLDAGQIIQATENPSIIESFLSLAKQKNISVELLLGDPSWALAEHRDGLLELISKLDKLPFDGLNLDIEPDSLTPNVTEQLVNSWLETIRLATERSPWPVSVTTHFRYLAPTQNSVCVPCELTTIGIHQASAMVFVTNPKRVIEIMIPILDAYPELRISVAQSFERHLSKEESYASFSTKSSNAQLTEIQNNLEKHKNFSGIVIQSWFNFRNVN
ncbi:MAG: TolC family protein [Pseudomonadales bacterium]|nr:TolC family protein [Pseudomonadales bacterium]